MSIINILVIYTELVQVKMEKQLEPEEANYNTRAPKGELN